MCVCTFVFAALGIRSATPNLPVRAKAFRAHRAKSVLLQDVLLLAAQLWAEGHPFVSIFPMVEATVHARLRQLTALLWTAGDSLFFCHNTPESMIPEGLFHLASN